MEKEPSSGAINHPLFADSAVFNAPSLPNDFVSRDNLFDYLDNNVHKALTLVYAGAGFGKSTLISGWLKKSNYTYSWISLQKSHNDIRQFLFHLIASIQLSAPDFGSEILPVLQAPLIPPADYFSVKLKNEIGNLSPGFILVLDDFHLIENSEVLQFVKTLLDPPLKNVHICILTRKKNNLYLSRLWIQNEINQIDSDQLRMSESEIERFLNASADPQILPSMRSAIREHSEGWAAGVRLFKLSLLSGRSTEDVLKISGRETDFFDSYFREEIFKDINKDTITCLLKISILSSFCPDLAAALCGSVPAESIFNENFFIILIDAENKWYRFHHLFHELLKREFEKRFSEEMRLELHKKAAYWFREHGLTDDALYHAGNAGINDWAASLVAGELHIVLNQDRDHILEKRLSFLPESSIKKTPLLLIARMWVMKDREAFDQLPKMLDDLIKSVLPDNDELNAQVYFFKGIVNFWNGRLALAAENFKKTLLMLPLEEYSGILGETEVYYALIMHMLGKGKEHADNIEKRLTNKNLPFNYRLKLTGALIFRYLLAGNLNKTIQASEYIIKIYSDGNPFILAWAEYLLGSAYLRQNRFEDAKIYLSEALKKRYILDLVSPADAFATYILVLQSVGSREEQEDALAEFRNFAEERNNPFFKLWYFSIRARLALRENDYESALNFFLEISLSSVNPNFLFWVENPHITYCRLLIAENTKESLIKASVLLKGYLDYAENVNAALLETEIHILSAVLKKKQKLESEAVFHLEKAVELAAPDNCLYLFTETLPDIQDLYSKINTALQSSAFIQNLRGENKKKQKLSVRAPAVSVKLTNRQMDVITLLEQRLTNQEIAEKLCISVSTVKRHTITIYRKLGAKNRREAVINAVKEGILILK